MQRGAIKIVKLIRKKSKGHNPNILVGDASKKTNPKSVDNNVGVKTEDQKPTNNKLKQKKILYLVIMIIVVIVAGIIGYFYFNNQHKQITINDKDPVETLTETELNNIAKQDIDPKDVKAASRKAEALILLGNPAEATKVYESINKSGSGNYKITRELSLSVWSTGDSQRAIELLNQAQKELNESNLSQDVKYSESRYIKNKLNEFKLEEANK